MQSALRSKPNPSNTLLILDFDGTITLRQGGSGTSFHGLNSQMDEEFANGAGKIFETYYPYEHDWTISESLRDKKMKEWWEVTLKFCVDRQVTKKALVDGGRAGVMKLRRGVTELFSYAASEKIAVLVFSAGLQDTIESFLNQESLLTSNVKVIANTFAFSEAGVAIHYAYPFVYAGNKHLIAQDFDKSFHKENVFLFGDHPNDALMCDDKNHLSVTRFCFLNGKEKTPLFDSFDVCYPLETDDFLPALEIVRGKHDQ